MSVLPFRRLLLIAASALPLTGCGTSDLPETMRIAAAYGAKLVCSGVFVSGRDRDAVIDEDLRPLSTATRLMGVTVDRDKHTVTVRAGPITRTAAYRPGIGCAVVLDADRRVAAVPASAAAVPAPDAPAIEPAIQRAVDAVAAEERPDGSLRTRAIVVLHHGRIVAEHYASGFGADMPLLGWSMSKSVTAALAGLLAADGRLRLDEPVAAAEWPAGDPRRAITVRHLLQMTSGLRFVEDYSPGNDSTRMLYTADDMAGYAARQPLAAAPGTRWSYSSGSTNLLARWIVRRLGGSQAAQDYMRARLFGPAGMGRVTFEEDASGTPVGSSYVYATARDWARFGQLFLAHGRAGERQVLPAAWVDFVRTPVGDADPSGNYGGSFWLNGRGEGAQRRFPDLPADAFFAQGHNGQVVGIFPSHDAVVVRMGWTTGERGFDINAAMNRILAALTGRLAGRDDGTVP